MALFPLGILSAAGAGGAVGGGDYELIESTILGTAQSSVTFSSLGTYSSTYKHLQIRFTARTSISFGGNQDDISCRFNGDSGNNYAAHLLYGTGSSVTSTNVSSFNRGFLGSMPTAIEAANVFGAGVIDFVDIYGSKNKTIRSFAGNHTPNSPRWVGLASSLWNNTTAITSVQLFPSSGENFVAGSRFSIYGIKV